MVHHMSRVTSREAALQLNVPPKRTAAWVEQGKVPPIGLIPGRSRGGKGVPVFELEAFAPLAEAYHQRVAPCEHPFDQGG